MPAHHVNSAQGSGAVAPAQCRFLVTTVTGSDILGEPRVPMAMRGPHPNLILGLWGLRDPEGRRLRSKLAHNKEADLASSQVALS
ncbi:hypothetical protein NDU88_004004 [Pleurodeles waltl]|uniref:Uncharacterized protein n=1 Tax=Pleurodeles waltl TaxID=8319 RepID=A0AAV7T749_PLEWA|nr:hypothetical protein NDU88_004004 [Pleurodeles waltl]